VNGRTGQREIRPRWKLVFERRAGGRAVRNAIHARPALIGKSGAERAAEPRSSSRGAINSLEKSRCCLRHGRAAVTRFGLSPPAQCEDQPASAVASSAVAMASASLQSFSAISNPELGNYVGNLAACRRDHGHTEGKSSMSMQQKLFEPARSRWLGAPQDIHRIQIRRTTRVAARLWDNPHANRVEERICQDIDSSGPDHHVSARHGVVIHRAPSFKHRSL